MSLTNLFWSDGALVLMQGRGPSDPEALLLLPLTGDPLPLTRGLVSSLPAAGRSRVLRNMDGLGAEIILLVHQDPVLSGCVLEGGLGKRKLVSRYCSLHRLGRNLLGGMSRSVHSGNGEGWMLASSELRFCWWRSTPG